MNVHFRRAFSGDVPRLQSLFSRLGLVEPFPAETEWAAWLRGVHVAEDTEGVCGFVRSEVRGARLQVIHVVVDPRVEGRGLGTRMMRALGEHASQSGCSDWALNVRTDNPAALRLYVRMGMIPVGRGFSLSVPAALAFPEVDGFLVRPPRAAECAALDRWFELPAGRVAHWREDVRTGLRVAWDARSRPAALAHLAGTRVDVLSAGPSEGVVAVVRTFQEEAEAGLEVLVDCAPGAERLVRLGARLRFELLRMQGEINAALETPPPTLTAVPGFESPVLRR